MPLLDVILRACDGNGFRQFLRNAKTHDLPLIYAKCVAKQFQGFAQLTLAELHYRQGSR